MLRMTVAAAVAIAFATASYAVVPESEFIPPVGTYSADEMQIVSPPELLEIEKKLDLAREKDPVWFNNYLKKHSEGGSPLPYDPHFGIDKSEYERFLQLVESALTLKIVSRSNLSVAENSSGLRLNSDVYSGVLNGVVIDKGGNFVDTHFGRLTHKKDINQKDPLSPTGPWKGVQWENDNNSERIAFGRLNSGKRILYYRVVGSSREITVILEY